MPNSGPPNSHLKRQQPISVLKRQMIIGRGICQAFSLLIRFSTRIEVASDPSSQTTFLSLVMMHCTIFQSGISKLSFLEAGYAVNPHNFIILWIAVIPFIRQYRGYGRYWLQMDLASAHYANDMLVLLQQQIVCFVPKDANPPCVTMLQPVEDFWAALKKAVQMRDER